MFLNIRRYFYRIHRTAIFIFGIFKAPFHFSVKIPDSIHAICETFGSINYFTRSVCTAVDLTAHTMGADSIAVIKVDTEKIVLVARNPSVPSAVTYCFLRWFPDEPVYDINVMDMGIEYMVTAKPAEIIPVSYHVFHIVPSFLPFTKPHMILIPECLC